MNRKKIKYVGFAFVGILVLCVSCLIVSCGRTDKSKDEDAISEKNPKQNKASQSTDKLKQEEFTRHSSLGISYLNQEKYDDAVAEFRKALEIKPKHLPTIINLGLSYHHNYKYAEAEEVFKMALEIDPDEPYSHYNLGWIYREQGEYDKGVEEFEMAASIDSADPAVLYNLGMAYLKERKLEKAAEQFRRVIKSYPDSAPAYYSLGRVLTSMGKKDEARDALTKFQELKTAGLAGSEREKYLREGKYLEPIVTLEEAPQEVAQKPTKVYFLDVTESSGLTRIRG